MAPRRSRTSRMPRSAADMRRSTSRSRDIRPTSSRNNTTQASSSGGGSTSPQLPKPGNNWANYAGDNNLSVKEINKLTTKWAGDPLKSTANYWVDKAQRKDIGVGSQVWDAFGITKPTTPPGGSTELPNITGNNFYDNPGLSTDIIVQQIKDEFANNEALNAPMETTGLAPSGSGVSSMATSWRSRKGRRARAGRGAQGVNSMTIRPTNNTSGVGLNI